MISRRAMMNDEIVSKSGELLQLEKCKGSYLNGLRLFGKSEQFTTTGVNLLDPTNIKKYPDPLTVAHTDDGGIVVNGTSEVDTAVYFLGTRENSVPVFEGDYCIRFYGATSKENIMVGINGSTSKQISANESLSYNGAYGFIALVFKANKAYNNFRVYPMFNKSNAPKPFEPFTGGKPSPSIEFPQEIVTIGNDGQIETIVRGKNLLTGRMYHCGYSSGISYVLHENEVVLPVTPDRETHGIGYVVPCEAGKQYTFSVTNPNINFSIGIAEYEDFVNSKSYRNAIDFIPTTAITKTYTAKGNGVLVCIIAGTWLDGYTKIHTCTSSELLQLETGETKSTYEPPRVPQKLLLHAPTGLPGIPVTSGGNYTDETGQQWVCDEIDLERGKYVQRIAVQKYNNLKFILLSESENKFQNVSPGAYKFKGATYPSMSNFARYVEWVNKEGSFAAFDKFFYYRHTEKITLDEINALFGSVAHIKILGQLETPVETDLPPEVIEAYKSLHTYAPTTIVSNDADAGMEVSYRKVRG